MVTGIGVISCVGHSVQEFARSLRDGVSGAAPVTLFDATGFEHANVCEVKGFVPDRYLRRQSGETLGRSAQFAVAAARLAQEDAGMDPDANALRNWPVILGTTDGESAPFELLGETFYRSGVGALDTRLLDRVPAQQIAIAVAREFGLTGEALTISTACAAGNYALGVGFDLVCSGEVEIVLCGGSDSICRKTFAGFYRLGTVAPVHCQPFDADRRGILTGEGSAVLVLESWDSAVRRGARIYAELLGYAVNCDAEHMVMPSSDRIAACMRSAHTNAGIASGDVDFVCMHGTGTRANDIAEVGAVKAVFGERPPPVSSIKSSLGHAMGAASAFGAVACCVALTENFLPPTINLHNQDPACDVDVVANRSRSARPHIVQNNAFAFGGNNSITLFQRVTEARGRLVTNE